MPSDCCWHRRRAVRSWDRPKNRQSRQYDPQFNVWSSADPVDDITGDPTSELPYAYANDNPTEYSDPTGMYGCSPSADACVTTTFPDQGFGDDLGAILGAIGPVESDFFVGGLGRDACMYRAQPLRVIAHVRVSAKLGVFAKIAHVTKKIDDVAETISIFLIPPGARLVDFGIDAARVGIGRYAAESIAARSAAGNFTAAERAEINRIGLKSGCWGGPGFVDTKFMQPDLSRIARG